MWDAGAFPIEMEDKLSWVDICHVFSTLDLKMFFVEHENMLAMTPSGAILLE